MSVLGIDRRALQFQALTFPIKKKSMRSWSHCNVCVFVFLPNDENQCGRITRNIEKTRETRPGLKNRLWPNKQRLFSYIAQWCKSATIQTLYMWSINLPVLVSDSHPLSVN